MAVVGFAWEASDSPTSVSDGQSIALTQRFIVKTSSLLDGPMTVLGAPGLPQKGFVYQRASEFNAYLFCQERSVEKIGRYHWAVECEFRPYNQTEDQQQRQQNPTGDPLFDLPRIRLETVKRQVETLRDRSGTVITNSAGEPFLPAAPRDDSYPRLTIVRNEPITTPITATMSLVLDKLNSGTFWGKTARFWKMQEITVESATKTVNLEAGPVYYAYLIVTYVIEGKDAIAGATSGWDYEPLNYGEHQLVSGSLVRIKSKDGVPMAWFLNADGTKGSESSPAATYEAYELYDEANFNALQLPQSFLDAVDL